MQKLKKTGKNNKAVSTVIAVLLMIAIAVLVAFIAYAWIMGYINFSTTQTGRAIQIQSVGLVGDKLLIYIQNVGQGTVNFDPNQTVYINSILKSSIIGSSDRALLEGKTATINVTGQGGLAGQTVTIRVVTLEGTIAEITTTLPGIIVTTISGSTITTTIIGPTTITSTSTITGPTTLTSTSESTITGPTTITSTSTSGSTTLTSTSTITGPTTMTTTQTSESTITGPTTITTESTISGPTTLTTTSTSTISITTSSTTITSSSSPVTTQTLTSTQSSGTSSYTLTTTSTSYTIPSTTSVTTTGTTTSSATTTTSTSTSTTQTYTITATAGSGGTISPSGSVVLNYGASQTFNLVPNAGYHIADVRVDGVSVGAGSSYTFTNVKADHTIYATFAINTYTITASAGPNGQISPSGTVIVNYGASQTFTIAANGGYKVFEVIVAGVSQGTITSYTFSNVQANHVITASFVTQNSVIENFNNPGDQWDDNWDYWNNPPWRKATDQYRSAPASATSDWQDDGYFSSDPINTQGANAIHISFWYMVKNTDNQNDLRLYYSGSQNAAGGSLDNWNQVPAPNSAIGRPASDMTWYYISFTIGRTSGTGDFVDASAFSSTFRFRFNSVLISLPGGTTEQVWVDDVCVELIP